MVGGCVHCGAFSSCSHFGHPKASLETPTGIAPFLFLLWRLRAEVINMNEIPNDAIIQHMVPFTEAVIRYVKGFTIDGRASRSELWWAMLFAFALIGGITTLLGGTVFNLIFTITFIILDVCIVWRRMHDLGKTGLWSLVPFYNLYLAIKPSVLEENKYGPIPNTNHIKTEMPHKIIVVAIFIVSLALFFKGQPPPPPPPPEFYEDPNFWLDLIFTIFD